MAFKKRWFSANLRYPKTRQELRANQERNDPYVRGKRRNLPTAWDDNYVHKQKSWKYLGRDNQYRENTNDYDWHEFEFSYRDIERTMIAHNIMDWLERTGCYYKRTRKGLKWFGPNWWIRNHCKCCYTRLINDFLSEKFGDWCPNPNCCFVS
jgi:hypothetical protein